MTALVLSPIQQYLLHLVVGAAIAVPSKKYWFWASLVAGIAKESFDEISYGGFDYIDLLFTVLGGYVGHLLHGRLKKQKFVQKSNDHDKSR